ncbi:MAG: response regulator [Desulfobacteraceae bacterium]|nr:response regulator [Desulfobacteraceae bacterium]
MAGNKYKKHTMPDTIGKIGNGSIPKHNSQTQADMDHYSNSIFQNLGTLTYTADSSGQLIYLTQSKNAITGYSAENMLGSNGSGSRPWFRNIGQTPGKGIRYFEDIIHEADRPMVITAMTEAFENSGSYDIEYRIVPPRNSPRWISDNCRVTMDKLGKKRIEGVIFDIHLQKQREEINSVIFHISNVANNAGNPDRLYELVRENLSRVMDISNFNISAYDKKNDTLTFVYWADQVRTPPPDNIIKNIKTRSVEPNTAQVIIGGKTILHTKEQYLHTLNIRGVKPLMPIPEIWLGVPIKMNNEVIGAIVVQSYHNQGLYTSLEAQLLETVANFLSMAINCMRIEGDLKSSDVQYQEVKTAIESAKKSKSRFLENMSHEIRTPLNGIIGNAILTLDTKLSQEQKEYLIAIENSADHLLTVINDIFDYQTIETGKLAPQQINFDLAGVVKSTCGRLAVNAHDKGLEFNCHIKPYVPNHVVGDPKRLRQILHHLVDNAIKYTPKGSVSVMCDVRGQDDETAEFCFTISDTGIGIDTDKQELIFESFKQTDSNTMRSYGGAGLGLSITRRLAKIMNGKIWLISRPGRGSNFFFMVKLKTNWVNPENKVDTSQTVLFQKKRILVVDDNLSGRRAISEILCRWSLPYLTVPGGLEALAAMKAATDRREPFDLVLIDSQMPEMDGFELSRHIKENPEYDNTAIIIMEKRPNKKGNLNRCREAGIEGYITKPDRQKDLEKTIQLVLSIKRSSEKKDKPETQYANAEPGKTRACKILLAEDNNINSMMVVKLLSKKGHETIAAVNGRQTVSIWQNEHFDLILMDIQMPLMDGFLATSKIRIHEQTTGGHIPIIAMTAHALKGDRSRCIEAGMDDYLAKPINPDELYDIIEKWSGNKGD